MTWRRLPGLDRRTRRRVLVAVGVGLAGELGALGLLTTGAWLADELSEGSLSCYPPDGGCEATGVPAPPLADYLR